MKNKRIIAMLLALTLTLGLAGCSFLKKEEPEPEPVAEESVIEEPKPESEEPEKEPLVIEAENIPAEDIPEGMVKSLLTGEYVDEAIGKRRPVAFMIDNVQGAFPHYGFRNGGVMIEAPVDTGEQTRKLLIMEDYDDLDRIGSLRSSRDYYISYALGFDAIYCHYGQAAYALPFLEDDIVNNISGLMPYGGNFFYRSSDLVAPHNAQASGKSINEAIEYLGYEKNHKDDVETSFKFQRVGESIDMSSGEDAKYVTSGFASSNSSFVYNEEDGLYYRSQFGSEEIDGATNEQVRVKNVLLEYENCSNYEDSTYLHFEVKGKGRGKYLTDGKAIDITWEREDQYSPAKYYTADGEELRMNTGKTYVLIIDTKHIEACKIGTSRDDAHCVVSDEEAAKIVAEGEQYHRDFKANEGAYFAWAAAKLNEMYAKHGGKSKASPIYDQY